jgi:hypothetical protein
MGIDIRLPVGILFILIGAILAGFGLASDRARYQQSLGLNINLYWGAALFVFGVVMLWLGRRGAQRQKTSGALEPEPASKTTPRSSSPSGHRA